MILLSVQQNTISGYVKPCQEQVEQICLKYPQIVNCWPIDYDSLYLVYSKTYGLPGMKWDTIKRRAREYRQKQKVAQ